MAAKRNIKDVDNDSDSEEISKLKKSDNGQKQNQKVGAESFSNAMNAILDSHLKSYDRKEPILSRSKKEIKLFENDKLEKKAKRLLLAERKNKLTANRNRNLLPTNNSNAREILDHEVKLRKTAQKGVIKLFNAILITQSTTESNMNSSSLIGESKKKELVNEISKEKFLDLVQKSGK